MALKKLAFYLIAAALLLAATTGRSQVEIPLSESHWAYSAMSELADRGLAPGYEAVDFQGRTTYTREQMARAVVAVQDLMNIDPSKFSSEDTALLNGLKKEFAEELERLGELHDTTTPSPDKTKVPVEHFSYKALQTLADHGLLPGMTGAMFQGGRVFTRTELASYTAQVMVTKQQKPGRFKEDDLQALAWLAQEFETELAGLPGLSSGTTGGAPRDMFVISGTGNLFIGVTKGDKASITNRLTFDGRGGRVRAYMSGTLDNTDRTGADIDFGHTYAFEVTKKLVGYHTNADDAASDSYLLMGNVNNIDVGSGLTVGAANVKGIYASMANVLGGRASAFWGDDTGGGEYMAARYENRSSQGRTWGVTATREENDTGAPLHAAGFDFSTISSSRRMDMEYTFISGAGRGLFMKYSDQLNSDLGLRMEYRNYRDFILEHNNPPKYLGRSGGDGENEKSAYVRLQWRHGRQWSYSLSRDHIYSPDIGRRTNVFFGQEYRPSQIWLMAWGWERERGGDAAEPERSVKLRYRGWRDAVLAGTWRRSIRTSGPSSTTRLDLSWPMFDDAGKIILSLTRRLSTSQRTNSYRLRFSGPLGGIHSASLSYDYSPLGTNKFDMNMTWKF